MSHKPSYIPKKKCGSICHIFSYQFSYYSNNCPGLLSLSTKKVYGYIACFVLKIFHFKSFLEKKILPLLTVE